MHKRNLVIAVSLLIAQTCLQAAPKITVDFNQVKFNNGSNKIQGICSGFLHPFANDATKPPKSLNSSLIRPLNTMHARTQTGSVDEYRGRFGSNVKIVGTLSGSWNFGTPPWRQNDWTRWENFVRTQVREQVAAGSNPIYAVWNEPTKSGPNWTGFKEAYRRAVNIIRQEDPQAQITGPNITFGATGTLSGMKNTMNNFRNFCINRNVVPDYYTFHFGGNQADDLARHVKGYSGVNKVIMSEYVIQNWAEIPGTTARQIANLENNAPLEFATRAQWGTDKIQHRRGTFGGLLLESGNSYKKTGLWWVYQRYAKMHNHARLRTTTSNNKLTALAGRRNANSEGRILLANNENRNSDNGYEGTAHVDITNIRSIRSDGRIFVKLERIPHNNENEVTSPTVVQSGYVKVVNKKVRITFNWGEAKDAYFVQLGAVKTG